MFCQFYKDIGCRCDRIRTQEQRKPCFFGSCQQSPCGCYVSCDVSVLALWHLCSFYLHLAFHNVGILAEVVTCSDYLFVCLYYIGLFSKLLFQVCICMLQSFSEDKEYHSQGEHISALQCCLAVGKDVFYGFNRETCYRSFDELVI